jgi:hypothetical protein
MVHYSKLRAVFHFKPHKALKVIKFLLKTSYKIGILYLLRMLIIAKALLLRISPPQNLNPYKINPKLDKLKLLPI